MAKKKVLKQIELPLIKRIDQAFSSLFDVDTYRAPDKPFEIPAYLTDNLRHHLRPYQKQALINLDWTQRRSEHTPDYRQLLFNMATGSGKTDLMAAIILYMYAEYRYQNFLFVVNTNAVVAKTYENLLNGASAKYLFRDPLTIAGQHLEIMPVHRFPDVPVPGVLYLRLTTIQSLANELNSPRENGLTYESLAEQKLVILADEAHHFSAQTKSKTDQLNHSWENVLDRVRQGNSANRQFEFTATIDLQDELVYQKYRDKIVYRYDLSQFIYQGYSKRVYRLQANNDDQAKMLNAVLLSQYRKRLARQLKIPDFKPVILFKSNKITVSKATRAAFITLISELTVTGLQNFIKQQTRTTISQALKLAYAYWLKQDLATVVVELKRDFKTLNTINVNESAKEGILGDLNDLTNLNTLENPDNPFRVIFAVAKLSEGWDVLNLYDIVRIGEQPTTLNQTNSEAQLIGRGARYNPFSYQGKRSYTRRFDQAQPAMQLLEGLYYHTINEPKYLDNLKKSLDKMDLPVEDDTDYDVLTTTVKPKFKRTNIYKTGNLFYNTLENVPETEFNCLKRYGVNTDMMAEVNLVDTTSETTYNAAAGTDNALTETRRVLDFKTDQRIVKKAMSRNKFFRFATLKQYIPPLTSLHEFMTNENWLGNIRLDARVSRNAAPLDRPQQLHAVEQYLAFIQNQITRNFKRQRGTNQFKPMPIKDVVADYQKKVPRHFANPRAALIQPYPMHKQDWYVYEEAIVDQLEKSCIDLIANLVGRFRQKFDNVYLIRNDERNSDFKLHAFGADTEHYSGFMPDFILYLGQPQASYQIYIEPKGDQLLNQDQWKEELLKTIRPENIDLIGENQQVKLYGVRFFTKGDARQLEKELEELNLLPEERLGL